MSQMIEILKGVSGTFKECGMAKGIRRDRSGKVCLMGAFDAQTDNNWSDKNPITRPALDELAATIRKSKYAPRLQEEDTYNGTYCPANAGTIEQICAFNNHPDTTQSQVLAVLRRCRQKLARRG